MLSALGGDFLHEKKKKKKSGFRTWENLKTPNNSSLHGWQAGAATPLQLQTLSGQLNNIWLHG